jgi:hypothetical protein
MARLTMRTAACAPPFRWILAKDRDGLEPHAGDVDIMFFAIM